MDEVIKVVDGDSVHLMMTTASQVVTEDLALFWTTAKPWKCRLVIVDTPERGEEGWSEARSFVIDWLTAHDGNVRAETYYRDNFGRMLTDVYVASDRGDTLSQALLQAGYDSYVR